MLQEQDVPSSDNRYFPPSGQNGRTPYSLRNPIKQECIRAIAIRRAVVPTAIDIGDHAQVFVARLAIVFGPTEVVAGQDVFPVFRPHANQGMSGFRRFVDFLRRLRRHNVFENERPIGDVKAVADAAPEQTQLQSENIDNQATDNVRLWEWNAIDFGHPADESELAIRVCFQIQQQAIEFVEKLIDGERVVDRDRNRRGPGKELHGQTNAEQFGAAEASAQRIAAAGQCGADVEVEHLLTVVHVQADLIADADAQEPPQFIQVEAELFELF